MDNINPMKVEKDIEIIYIFMTDKTRIRGTVHRPPRGRLSDTMNYQTHEKPFIAVTDATILFPNGNKHSAPFITVNRLNITTCFPVETEDEE